MTEYKECEKYEKWDLRKELKRRREYEDKKTWITEIRDYMKYDIFYKLRDFIIDMPKEIKYFIQRGIRGYSDRDCWSLNYYLSKVISSAVRKLRNNINGIPVEFIYNKDGKKIRAVEEAEKIWVDILDKIIEAFEILSNDDIMQINYDEVDEEKLNKIIEHNKEIENTYKEFGFDPPVCRLLTKEEFLRVREGMNLFIEHFQNLFD